jgi:glycosyltransferase involved in cell wall biosynthesis
MIVSHPIQYYVPLYQRLALREDVDCKVFFTWHDAVKPVLDHGFKQQFTWDIPLTSGYKYQLITNVSSAPGTQRFFGLRNPELFSRVSAWRPDVVHITGWAWWAHLRALQSFSRRGMPTLFRGDSHLLDTSRSGPKWWLKQLVLRRIFSLPSLLLNVGTANRQYYEAFGVELSRLHWSPHSIDVRRFSVNSEESEARALAWRHDLGIPADCVVVLFAGKFERKKQPIQLMKAISKLRLPKIILVLVGAGELQNDIVSLAAQEPCRFRVLPFQNQSVMPIVYRLGDLFVLPSAYGETWGLAVNEALACGRPVLVSDKVGCGIDTVDESCGDIFRASDSASLEEALRRMCMDGDHLRSMRRGALERAWAFDISCTEETLLEALRRCVAPGTGER